MLTSFLFYPSLGYNLLRNQIQPKKWMWYNRIDDGLVLGAMPFKSMKEDLIKKENVGGVVCCTEPYELKAAWKAMNGDDWKAEGVEFHAIPMTDFFGSAARGELQKAVNFMKEINDKGKSVYVHCKAGRMRSATVATCYLMQKKDWLPNVAFEFIKGSRPQVLLRSTQWRTVNEYRRWLDTHPQFVFSHSSFSSNSGKA
ncbi:unnamed protein product, partial [Mesorhabditis belari]|uniref:Phosphatidylglycerophosphatase and protein-tyrosine phosphatase 1 n=1 Tax=Mesorhabditis belari TaxID=2138241 RepID=A0AAF3ENG5_9BILA